MPRDQRCGAAFLLGALLLGCGQTDRNRIGSQAPTAGVSAGGSSSAGGGSPVPMSGATESGGEASAGAPISCLYPARQVDPLDRAEADVADYTLSSPFPIAIPTARWGGLAGAFDQNGDWVSDLLVRDQEAQRYRLLLSGRPPDVLAFSEVDCAALDELPYGRLLLRDLDADGVPDFVIGIERGIVAFLNHPQGLEQVLDFSFASPNARAALINLEAIDLDADGRVELLAGFDRIFSEAEIAFETGVVSFFQTADGSFVQGESVSSPWSAANGSILYSGYFTAGRFGDSRAASALIAVSRSGSVVAHETSFAKDGSHRDFVSSNAESIIQLFALPRGDGRDLLGTIGGKAVHVIDVADQQRELFSSALDMDGNSSHEFGGGPESPRYFFVDIDRDGDEDFLERTATGLRLQVNLENAAFASPQLLDSVPTWGSENPFINVGPATAIVAEAEEDPPARVYTLYSNKNAAK